MDALRLAEQGKALLGIACPKCGGKIFQKELSDFLKKAVETEEAARQMREQLATNSAKDLKVIQKYKERYEQFRKKSAEFDDLAGRLAQERDEARRQANDWAFQAAQYKKLSDDLFINEMVDLGEMEVDPPSEEDVKRLNLLRSTMGVIYAKLKSAAERGSKEPVILEIVSMFETAKSKDGGACEA